MTEIDLIDKIKNIVAKRGYRPNDFPDRGSIRAAAYLTMGFSSIDYVALCEPEHLWDRHFRVGKVVELFANAPGVVSAAIIISFMNSTGMGGLVYDNVLETAKTLDSASLPKTLSQYDDVRQKRHGMAGSALSTIMLSIDIVQMLDLIDSHRQFPLEFLGGVYARRVIRELTLNPGIYREAHPVVLDIHSQLLTQLKTLRDQELKEDA